MTIRTGVFVVQMREMILKEPPAEKVEEADSTAKGAKDKANAQPKKKKKTKKAKTKTPGVSK